MLGFEIENLKVRSKTAKGLFGADFKFEKGLNIIRAENSSGKSTIINAIAYSLGLDPILGPSRKRPFPRAMYNALEEKKDDSDHLDVKSSFVEMTISNNSSVATLRREVKGNDKVIRVTILDESSDYFLGASGSVGSAKSELGFHFWLEKFMGWDLPFVTKHEGGSVKLYLECIFPLFFIEQKRGWSEIQANTPTHYGIKDLKKTALEFCLGISDYSDKIKIATLKSTISDLENHYDRLVSSACSVAEFSRLIVHLDNKLSLKNPISPIRFMEPGKDSPVYVSDRLIGTEKALISINSKITSWPDGEKLKALMAKRRSQETSLKKLLDQKISLTASIDSAENKISRIEIDLDRYKQLKRLKDVGSDLPIAIELKTCPICDSEMYDTLDQSTEIKPLPLDKNISYLKEQLSFYKGIISRFLSEINSISPEINSLESKLEAGRVEIDALQSEADSFIDLFAQDIKEKSNMENYALELKRVCDQEKKLNSRAKDIYKEWNIAKSKLAPLLKKRQATASDDLVASLESLLIDNVKKFGYKEANLQHLKISRTTLRPELDGYDIVADSSASDYIRIIWSFTLSLLQLATKYDVVRHSGFIVLDEPRQHETNKASFESMLRTVDGLGNSVGQVIVATSMPTSELESIKLGPSTNIKIFEDGKYILSRKAND